MASADFCALSITSRQWLLLSEHSAQTSLGTTRFFPSIHLPHLLHMIPCSYRASSCMADLPSCTAFYTISVRQTILWRHTDSGAAWEKPPILRGFFFVSAPVFTSLIGFFNLQSHSFFVTSRWHFVFAPVLQNYINMEKIKIGANKHKSHGFKNTLLYQLYVLFYCMK